MSAGLDPRSDQLPLSTEISNLAQVVMKRLKQSPYLPLRKLSCRWQNGVLALTGRVPTQHLKQTVSKLLGDLGPVTPTVDQIEVISPGQNQRRVP